MIFTDDLGVYTEVWLNGHMHLYREKARAVYAVAKQEFDQVGESSRFRELLEAAGDLQIAALECETELMKRRNTQHHQQW